MKDTPQEPADMKCTPWHLVATSFLCCPLCGHGEAGSQHLCIWCPAVAYAWNEIAGPGITTVIADIARKPKLAHIGSLLAQQVVFLYGSLAGRAWQDLKTSGTELVRG
eukprot:16055485-Heterocapsa_arctica.AAC.1